jgi:hypothetical protein
VPAHVRLATCRSAGPDWAPSAVSAHGGCTYIIGLRIVGRKATGGTR